jgi:hypothetical protein
VDVSVWPRCDAECSPLPKASTTIPRATTPPDSPSRGRVGLSVHRSARLRPRELERPGGRGARASHQEHQNAVGAEQVRALLERLPTEGAVPLFVFDAFSTIRCRCRAQGLEGCRGQILVRLRAGGCF